MNTSVRRFCIVGFMAGLLLCAAQAMAAAAPAAPEMKVGTISIQKVVEESKAGQEAKKVLEAKQNELKPKFEAEQQALQEQAKEIEKKSSGWNEEVRSNREREYQKKMREYQLKVEDAQFELKQLEKKVLGPIFKELQTLIAEFGKQKGYTLILERSQGSGILYATDALDVSEALVKDLDARMATPAK